MNPMKRVGLAVLLAVGVTLLASTPAWAGDSWTEGPIELWNVGDEPGASGEATLTNIRYLWVWSDDPWGRSGVSCYSGTLSVSCQNLTPGATYRTPAGTFKAKPGGIGSIKAKVVFTISWISEPISQHSAYVVDVVRLDPDGSSTTVLTGEFFGAWW